MHHFYSVKLRQRVWWARNFKSGDIWERAPTHLVDVFTRLVFLLLLLLNSPFAVSNYVVYWNLPIGPVRGGQTEHLSWHVPRTFWLVEVGLSYYYYSCHFNNLWNDTQTVTQFVKIVCTHVNRRIVGCSIHDENRGKMSTPLFWSF